MSKRLFITDDPNCPHEPYTKEGILVSDKMAKFIGKLLKQYPDYSLRDLELIVTDGVRDAFLEARVGKVCAERAPTPRLHPSDNVNQSDCIATEV